MIQAAGAFGVFGEAREWRKMHANGKEGGEGAWRGGANRREDKF